MWQINEEQRNNILQFLNRAPVKGLRETEAMMDIVMAFVDDRRIDEQKEE